MPLNFPTSPAVNEQYTFAGRTWVWNGSAWDSYNPGITAYVSSFNNLTGAVTGVTTSNTNIFTALQTFSNGLVATGATLSGTVAITGLSIPTADADAANKAYVDDVASIGVHYHTAVVLASTDAETFASDVAYSNGASGVGATLTKTAPFARLNIDSTDGVTADRILIRSATTQQWNGVYDVTNQGSASGAWILTRSADANNYHPYFNDGLGANDYFFVTSGASLKNNAYICNVPDGITFGTTPITFALFSTPPVYTAGTGLALNSLQFSNTGVLSVNGITGAVTGVASFNGETGDYKLLFGAGSKQTTAVGLTAQLDYIAFNDFESQILSASAASNGGVWALGNANGGSATVGSTTQITNFGYEKCYGVATISTGTTNNLTGYSGVVMQSNLLPGIVLPTTGFVSRCDFEILWRTDSTTHADASQVYYRAGFSNTWTNVTPTDGIYFEFAGLSAAQADTQWQIVFTNGGSSERFSTGVTMAASKTYKMDLSVERSTAGTVTTSYTVTNVTDNFTSTNTATPGNSARLITGTTDYVTPGCSINKTGTATTTSRLIQLDYIGARLRRPIQRPISIL